MTGFTGGLGGLAGEPESGETGVPEGLRPPLGHHLCLLLPSPLLLMLALPWASSSFPSRGFKNLFIPSV